MRIFITGPKKSGKSLWAENTLLSSGKKLGYIGTLPKTYDYYSRIKNHRIRRDSRWETYEISSDWEYDYVRLQHFFRGSRPILLDGLSILIWRMLKCSTSADWPASSHDIILPFIEILKNSKCDWVIVDSEQPYAYSNETKQFIEVTQFIHEQIINNCNANKKSIIDCKKLME